MYPCSNAFHEAVKNGNEQKLLLIFSDVVFTNEDIDADAGLEFDDTFFTDADITIGTASSNEIRFTLFNDDRHLNSYEFGEFTATLGVYLDSARYEPAGNVMIQTTYASFVGSVEAPFLTMNGVPVAVQPGFAVTSLLAYDARVWAFGSEGQCAAYNGMTGEKIRWTIHPFMAAKVKRWSGTGYVYDGGMPVSGVTQPRSRVLKVYTGGTMDRYEFVPLGVFNAERPNVPDNISVALQCYDRMQNFEKDMPTDGEMGVTYPTTLGDLLAKLCAYAGVPLRSTAFVNSGATVDGMPDGFDRVTMRTVVAWIAEAAGSNARIDRDGYLVMDWISDARHATGQIYRGEDYSDFQPYWYETRQVDKLHVRRTSDGTDRVLGAGENAYLIQDNPLIV